MDSSHEISTRTQTSIEENKESFQDSERRDSLLTDVTEKEQHPERDVIAIQETLTVKAERTQFGELKAKVSACRFDNDDMFVAVGCDDGSVKVYVNETKKLLSDIKLGSKEGNAILNLKWRPTTNKELAEHVFMASDADGYLYHVHASTKQILHTIFEENNQIYACDFNNDGTKFATGGVDHKVRVYDEKKKSHFIVLNDTYELAGHSNRILSMKFSAENPNILLTGSWDQTVKVWDLRAEHVIKSIYGVQVYGDCLDIEGDVILMGNYRDEKQLQLWDLGTKKLIENIDWDPRSKICKGAFITAAQFSRATSRYILAAAGKLNEIRLFDRNNNNKLCYLELTRENVYSVDFSNTSDTFVHGGDGSSLTISRII